MLQKPPDNPARGKGSKKGLTAMLRKPCTAQCYMTRAQKTSADSLSPSLKISSFNTLKIKPTDPSHEDATPSKSLADELNYHQVFKLSSRSLSQSNLLGYQSIQLPLAAS